MSKRKRKGAQFDEFDTEFFAQLDFLGNDRAARERYSKTYGFANRKRNRNSKQSSGSIHKTYP